MTTGIVLVDVLGLFTPGSSFISEVANELLLLRIHAQDGTAGILEAFSKKMAAIAYPNGSPRSGCLYFFREGWNPSGTRFIAFVKDPENGFFKAFSMTTEGAHRYPLSV